MEQLIKGKTITGKWYVRPISWAGMWKNVDNKDNVLVSGNTLYESDNEYDCDCYMMNYKLLELVKENPELPIVPMTYYEVCGGDSGYWMGRIISVEIREYAINEWNEDEAVLFKDDFGAEDKLIEAIAEYKYDGTNEDYDKAEIEAKEMWTKAIIVRINL